MRAKIYGMDDPRTGEIKYIGRTIKPLYMRINEHIVFARRKSSNCGRAIWICSLLEAGLRPGIFEIEEVPIEEQSEAEGFWISYFRYIGADLVNEQSHNVGGSKSYIIDWTPERIEKLGKVSDSELAVELGVDRKSIEYKRSILGIPRKVQTNFVVPPMGGWNKIELPQDIIERLGKVSDRTLARELGISKEVIQRARLKRGIPSWSEMQGNPTQFQRGMPHPRWGKKKS